MTTDTFDIHCTHKESRVKAQKLQLLCIRHGKTNYTDVFPDLTNEGMEHVRSVANTEIPKWIDTYSIPRDGLIVVSSPAPRAHGTASVIMEELGHTSPIILKDELGPTKWEDVERCKIALRGFSGVGYINYETEPVFADPELFETPGEVRARFYTFLAHYINIAFDAPQPLHGILVSHYESLCNITRDVFGIVASEKTALQYVEPIALSIALTNDSRYVYIAGTFRERKSHSLFDLVEQRMIPL